MELYLFKDFLASSTSTEFVIVSWLRRTENLETANPLRSMARISRRMNTWLTLGYWLTRYAIFIMRTLARCSGRAGSPEIFPAQAAAESFRNFHFAAISLLR